MPQKYRILSSHADAKPAAGRTVSNYPKRKGASKSKAKAKSKKGY